MASERPPFAEEDSVVVRPEISHPDLNQDLSGWQGRIVEITLDELFGELVTVEWDSFTLKQMPAEYVNECDREGIDWTRATLVAEALALTSPRDTAAQATEMAEEISERYGESYLGEQGARIEKVLAGTADDNAALRRWVDFLGQNLDFPFEAEVVAFQERGPLQSGDLVEVRRFSLVDDEHGIIVAVEHEGRNFDFPLSDLAVEEASRNYQLVDDYATWFDDREAGEEL